LIFFWRGIKFCGRKIEKNVKIREMKKMDKNTRINQKPIHQQHYQHPQKLKDSISPAEYYL
jgi:hypothetical protein